MTGKPMDTTPRTYPDFVSLVRRGHFDPVVFDAYAGQDLGGWLLSEAADEADVLDLFQAFAWRMVAAGLPLDRASLHVGTLHPQVYGYAWNWERADGLCDEIKVDEASLSTDAYRRNPLFTVIEYGEMVRTRIDEADPSSLSSLLRELAGKGITEYAALPLHAVGHLHALGRYHNAVTIATKQEGGFRPEQFAEIGARLKVLALHVQRHIADRISENALTTYLGSAAGRQVLDGSIRRGSGAPIDAVIWSSDLRGFTNLADRLSDQDMIAVLNEYFGRLAGAVLEHRGEVLKFIGDGLLAVFPFSEFAHRGEAASAALGAARTAVEALEALNGDPEILAHVDGWKPLRTGIGLHCGEVFFGNVGAPQRLDFTVIGKAVNAVARVEALTKTLGRPVLLTGDVAELLDEVLENLGSHELRGLAEPVALFAPTN